jgi:hypothetical protein
MVDAGRAFSGAELPSRAIPGPKARIASNLQYVAMNIVVFGTLLISVNDRLTIARSRFQLVSIQLWRAAVSDRCGGVGDGFAGLKG